MAELWEVNTDPSVVMSLKINRLAHQSVMPLNQKSRKRTIVPDKPAARKHYPVWMPPPPQSGALPMLNKMSASLQDQKLSSASLYTSSIYYHLMCQKVHQNLISDRQTHRQTQRHTDRQTDRQTDTHTDTQTHRQTDTQTHRHTDRHKDTQTDTQTDTQIHRHTDTQTDRHTDTNFVVLYCTYMHLYIYTVSRTTVQLLHRM